MSETDTLTNAIAAIAQGAINISEGLTTVEPGSRVHQGMLDLCKLVNNAPSLSPQHIELLEAAKQAARSWRAGAGAAAPELSRLVRVIEKQSTLTLVDTPHYFNGGLCEWREA